MPTFDSVLVTGNATIGQDLQVNGNETVQQDMQIIGNQTNMGGQLVRFYPAILAGQPGLVLNGTDGNNYVLFVDVSGGTPTLALMRA